MVVSKLETYVHTQIPGALYTANLRELIKEELSRGVLEPTLVLDSSSFYWLFINDESSIFEMRPRVVKKKVEDFVDKIISCKARLIVIKRSGETRIETWFYKNKLVKIDFEKCRREGVLDDFLKIQLNLPCKICTGVTLSTVSNEKYSVFTSDNRTTCMKVAHVAVKQNCFAVIGQDSDYLIYEGIRYYILTSSINTNTLDCTIYDRNKLIEHLQLKSYHLPLFATLCGNYFVSHNLLKDFHRRISRLNSNMFLDVANIIRKTTDNPYNHIKEMVALINHPMVFDRLLQESLDSYLNYKETVPMNKWLSFAIERKRNDEWNNITYTIFTSKLFLTTTMYGLDPNMHKILRSLRQNIYGVLFYEFDFVVIEEYCLQELKKRNKMVPVRVLPKKPQCEHPGLVQLWDRTLPELNSQKWDLFCYSVSKLLRPPILRKMPSKLLLPVLALHYLKVNSPSIFAEEFELETFLIVAILIHVNLPIKSAQSGELNFKAAQLIFFFTETCCMLQILNEACGLVISKQESCFCNFFDGVLIFYIYEEMKKGTRWNKFLGGDRDLEDKFCAFMDIILTQ